MKTTFLYKKKYVFLTMVWVLFSTQIFCQSYKEYTDAKQFFEAGKLIEAKQEIDKLSQNVGYEDEVWLLKAKIYNAISKDATLKEIVLDARGKAFSILKDFDGVHALNLLAKDSFALPLDIYKCETTEAIIYYNSAIERKDKTIFAEALSRFKKAISIFNFINDQFFGEPKIDSNNLFYAAKAAIYAGKDDDGLLFAKKIADKNIVKTVENKSFNTIYEWLVYYYRINKNKEYLQRYTDFGALSFPQSSFFILNKIDWLRESNQYNQMVPQYKLLFSKGFKQSNYYTAYFSDVFNIIFTVKDSTINKPYYKTIFEKEIKAYTTQNKTAFKEILLASKYYRNLAAEMQLAKENPKKIQAAIITSNTYLKVLLNKPKKVVPDSLLQEAKKLVL